MWTNWFYCVAVVIALSVLMPLCDVFTSGYCFFLVSVHFRFVVFRPFVDEILVGKIRSCSPEGVRGLSYVSVHQTTFV